MARKTRTPAAKAWEGLLICTTLVTRWTGSYRDGDRRRAGSKDTTTKSGSDVGTVSGKCLDAAKAMASATAAMPLAMTGGAANLQQSIDQLDAFANAAPTEIRADLKTVAAGYAKVAKVLKDSGYTAGQTLTPAAIQAFQKASTELDTDTFRAASDRVDAWFEKECDN